MTEKGVKVPGKVGQSSWTKRPECQKGVRAPRKGSESAYKGAEYEVLEKGIRVPRKWGPRIRAV